MGIIRKSIPAFCAKANFPNSESSMKFDNIIIPEYVETCPAIDEKKNSKFSFIL